MDDEALDLLRQYLPLIIPIILIQLALVVAALVDLVRRDRTRGPKWVWVLVIIIFNLIGPILYFVIARDEE